jgi:hypothetical protein
MPLNDADDLDALCEIVDALTTRLFQASAIEELQNDYMMRSISQRATALYRKRVTGE